MRIIRMRSRYEGLSLVGALVGLGIAFGGHLQAWAQPHVETAMKAQLGELAFTNAVLQAEIKRVMEENAALKKQTEECSAK